MARLDDPNCSCTSALISFLFSFVRCETRRTRSWTDKLACSCGETETSFPAPPPIPNPRLNTPSSLKCSCSSPQHTDLSNFPPGICKTIYYLDFCQAVSSQGVAFIFSLPIGSTFSSSWDSRVKDEAQTDTGLPPSFHPWKLERALRISLTMSPIAATNRNGTNGNGRK